MLLTCSLLFVHHLIHHQKKRSGLKSKLLQSFFASFILTQFLIVWCTIYKCLFHHKVVLNKVLSQAVYFGNCGSLSNPNIWKLRAHKDDRWEFSLVLSEIKTAVWSFCCIISSFTIQTELTTYPVPEGASAPTALGQAGSRELLQTAHSTEVPSQAQAGTHCSCLCCLWHH